MSDYHVELSIPAGEAASDHRRNAGLIQEGKNKERARVDEILAGRLLSAMRALATAQEHSKSAEASRELLVADAHYESALDAYRDVFLSTPGDLNIYSVPVWWGAWKIGTTPCGYCGSIEHRWTTCRSEKAEPTQQARAIACEQG